MNYRVRIAAALACLAPAWPLAAQMITEFPIPTAYSGPRGITAGPDGNLWFADQDGRIGRITTSGDITEFASSTDTAPYGIAAGPDGNLWFTDFIYNHIGRISTAGLITEFTVPTARSSPQGIAAGPDGNLWFTEQSANKIGRITTAGVITEFTIPTECPQNFIPSCDPQGIAAGPDGNLWFTELVGRRIGRITTAGVITEFPRLPSESGAIGITTGPDGNLWFTTGRGIGRITTAGVVAEFEVPLGLEDGESIAAGPDGNLWFTGNNNIGRITTAGVVTEFPIPAANTRPLGIAAGPDGNLWFTEPSCSFCGPGPPGARIGRITTLPAGPCAADDITLCLSGGRFTVTADFETQDGTKGSAHAVTLTPNTGYFWFFDPSNVEIVTKVLPFCADPFNSIWIFAAGLTNVKVELTYTDTDNGTVVTKKNDLGVPFAPVQDTSAFQTCP